MLSTGIHLIAALFFAFTLYYEFCVLKMPDRLKGTEFAQLKDAWPGKWKFLTVWDEVIQCVYHTYSFIVDVSGGTNRGTLHQIRDSAFASVVFPTGHFVTLTFWGLYAIDPELIFPAIIQSYYPAWLNHAVHTAPVVFLLLEFLCVPKVFPKRSTSIKANVLFNAVYQAWIVWLAYGTGVWVYPVLNVLNTAARVLFLQTCAALAVALYFLGERIQKILGGPVGDVGKSTKKTK